MNDSKNPNKEKAAQPVKKRPVNIDMNPVVDIGFLLLIFFMLTTTFIQPQTMEVTMPEKAPEEQQQKEQPVKESSALTLILAPGDTIYWFKGITDPKIEITDYSKDGIRKLLAETRQTIPGLVVLIKPDERSVFKNLVDILDEMSMNRVARYAIVDITEEDKALIGLGMQ